MKPQIAEIGLALGHTLFAVQKWRQRGAVPHRLRFDILNYAAKHEIKLARTDLDFAPTGQPQRRRKAA